MKKLFFVPLALGISLLFCAILIGGFPLSLYMDFVSLGINILIPACLLLINFSIKEMWSFLVVSMEKRDSDVETLKKALVFFKTVEKYQVLVGLVGTIYGLIGMLSDFGNLNSMGKGLATSLITVFYSIFIIVFFITPIKCAIEKKLID